MPAPKTLSLMARGDVCLPDPHAQDRGVRRCIGRRWQEVVPGRWAWVPTGEAEVAAYHHDLVRAVRDGDLWPGDAATAKAAGVAFDASFGSEPTESIKDFKRRASAPADDAHDAHSSSKKGG